MRYDCVWTHSCEIFQSANAYGSRSRHGKLPLRLLDGRRSGFSGTLLNGDTRKYYGIPFEDLGDPDSGTGQRKPIRLFQSPVFSRQFNVSPGVDGVFDPFGTLCPLPSMGCDPRPPFTDDPGPNVMRRYLDCLYGAQSTKGPTHGLGRRDLLLGIDDCKINSRGSLVDIPNPFRGPMIPRPFPLPPVPRPDGGDFVPWIGTPGAGELPYRPAPDVGFDVDAPRDQARGIYYPNARLARLVSKRGFGSNAQNFSETELSFNRGASQEQTKELKEAYLDIELFDSRLWLRLGRQNIVWGKTELFRTTDQFNPQDLALASLPSFEESRIPLWSARGIWSFYDVGPLEDVRLEIAFNYDEVQPSDLGRCGEPYTLNLVCQGAFGLHVHGILGLGVAGVQRPPEAWDSAQGIEVGGRLEWRWNRFSFAVSDFWGYEDFPTVEQLFAFERNVDPLTGRPRRTNSRAGCDPDGLGDVSGCLDAEDADGNGVRDPLELHSANQQIFAWICAMTVGVTTLDPASCGNTIFNSKRQLQQGNLVLPVTLAEFATALFAGNERASFFALAGFGANLPRLQPNADFNDGPGFPDPATMPPLSFYGGPGALGLQTISSTLTDEQEALLGCGRFFGTRCDVDGIDLLNTEASVFFQSFPGFEGTFLDWDLTDPTTPQPGTVDFVGGPVATRTVGGRLVILPGARGPNYQDGDYDPGVDGCTSPDDAPVCQTSEFGAGARRLLHPFFDPGPDGMPGTPDDPPFFQGQLAQGWDPTFKNELAVVSFNALMVLVAFSNPNVVAGGGGGGQLEVDEFDPAQPFRKDGCSFAKAHLCFAVSNIIDFTGVQRSTLRAGGSDGFGRRDFVWHIGTPFLVKFEKRNVLGFSADWADDRTKSNWSLETTWIEDLPQFDNDRGSLIRNVDTYNLTVSVDRPTFINFLNPNRTFFFNSQWFIQYIDGYRKSFSGNGPWNVLFTFTVQTGYFQDRMLPSITTVFDFRSSSGALLPQVTYRFTENFSATFGLNTFWGREQFKTAPLTQPGPVNRVGRHRDATGSENSLSVLRDRDEVFLRVKYTF